MAKIDFTPFIESVERTLEQPYLQAQSQYDGLILSIDSKLQEGRDELGSPFTKELTDSFVDLKHRLVSKKATETAPTVGGSKTV